MMTITTRELTTADWPQIEALFSSNGACGGCWCMSWRIGKGEKWDLIKGDEAKSRLRALIESGEAKGILAFAGEEPVGWCTFGPRRHFAKLDRAPSLACDDADQVWSIPCFFVKKGHRGQGVSRSLLAAAQEALIRHGAQVAEVYPAKPPADGSQLPAAFAWTGPRAMFDAAGFVVVGNPDGGKQRMRRALVVN
jgi:GNAT superfamily N-acetyltransferase